MKVFFLICIVNICFTQNEILKSFDVNSSFLKLPKGWNLQEIPSVAFTKSGTLLVFHRGDHNLLEFDSDGNFLREIGAGLFNVPHGLKVDSDGNIWTTDTGNHLVLRFSYDGRVTMVLGMKNRQGKGWFTKDYNTPFFDKPQDVALDSEGNIYVADRGNSLIAKFNKDGNRVLTWGTKGASAGEFNFAHSIVIDDADIIYVADRENKRIQKFNVNGNFIGEWKNVGYPYSMTIAPDNTIWYTDARAERIVNISKEGKILDSYSSRGKNSGQFGFVHGIALCKEGKIVISEVLNWRIQILRKK